jgi:hypothetical protein
VALLPLIAIFARFERPGSIAGLPDAPPIPYWRLVAGLLLISAGLAASAVFSIASPEGVTGVRLWIVAMPFLGAALVRFGPVYKLRKRMR